MSDQHDGPHNTAGPLAVPHGDHLPAGWVSAAEHERVERERVARELAREEEDAARAAREQAISGRLAERRAAGAAVEPEPEPEAKAKVKPQAGPAA
jgi:hypothetical protein